MSTTILEQRRLAGTTQTAVAGSVRPETIRRHVLEDGIGVLTFDRPESAANLFDRATLEELDRHLDFLAHESRLKGLILTSAKKNIFIAGADLHALANEVEPEAIREFIALGQSVFNRISALPVPTVAAIHGACLGGGYEICLACDLRLATPDRVTRIGLPETQLGLLPAWGGCTRLPRLIGLPRALKVILGGKPVSAQEALRYGMVDDLLPRELLLEAARQKVQTHGMDLRHRPRTWVVLATNNRPFAVHLRKRVTATILRKTRGHYPALLRALEVVTCGVARSLDASLGLELEAALDLTRTETCRNLVRLFFLQERAKKLMNAESVTPVRRLAVIGAGVMGAGIAHWASSREVAVILRDRHPDLVAQGLSDIVRLYDQGMRRRLLTPSEVRASLDRLFPAAEEVPLRNAELVIEAASEKMEVKRQIFQRLDELAGPRAVLASNTSSLSISDLAAGTKHPERVVGIHFFNPVHRMPLVEVIVGRQTQAEVVWRAVRFVQRMGKLPLVVKDSPGFLVNRVLMPYLMEAGYLFENGARVEDIDEAMLDFGMPMGPLRLLDEIGLDVCNHVVDTLVAHFSPRLQAPQALPRMLAAGLLGRKNGRGFYLDHHLRRELEVNPDIDHFHHHTAAAALGRDELQTRMVILLINEAARCLEEGLVAEPSDVDFGMARGAGFPAFLGGPLRFADYVGIRSLVDEMKRRADQGELRFAPCQLLGSMAASGKKFYANHPPRNQPTVPDGMACNRCEAVVI